MTEPQCVTEGCGRPVHDARKPKAADIPADEFLATVDRIERAKGYPANLNEVAEALGYPWKVVLAKANRLINAGFMDGCGCGCRGDFTVREDR